MHFTRSSNLTVTDNPSEFVIGELLKNDAKGIIRLEKLSLQFGPSNIGVSNHPYYQFAMSYKTDDA